MKRLQKLINSFSISKALSVLGPIQYSVYISSFLVNSLNVIRASDLRSVDKSIGQKIERFHYRNKDFLFDCKFCDEQVRDGSYAFGIAREIYIRDCYFKWQPPKTFLNSKTVIDLGANRGAFSVLMTTCADFVLSVEAQAHFVPVIRHNMKLNSYTNYAVEVGLVGAGGKLSESKTPYFSIQNLMERHDLKEVDFMKIDIEGSEFALFESSEWLQKVKALSMEIHPAFGDPNIILQALKQYNFNVSVADENLKITTDLKSASFVYAWKN